MEWSYEETRTPIFNHIDNHNITRPSAMFDFMQDIATSHALQLHLDKDSLSILWVLSRMQVRQMRPILPEESLRIRTVFDGLRGVSWCRSFTIWAGEEMVACARSSWAMLDPSDHHIIRPNTLAVAADMPKLGREYKIPDRLQYETVTPHHIHTVRYSDLDRNGHLNNVRIVDIIADGLELERIEDAFVSEIQVNYLSECSCGDALQLSVGQDTNGIYYVFAAADGQPKFEAAAKLQPYSKI